MDKKSADEFIFAKLSGKLRKSFVGERTKLLFEPKNLSELWTLLFNSPSPLVPETMLAQKIEAEAYNRFFADYVDLVRLYDKPSPVVIDLLCEYDVENLKLVLAALCNEEQKMPAIADLQEFAQCDFAKWPDIQKITQKTQFEWLNSVPDIHHINQIDFKLDIQVIKHLWKSLEHESGEIKAVLEDLFYTEFIIKNVVWMLRLKLFYKMDNAQIADKLIYVTSHADEKDPVAGPVIHLLNLPLDEYDAWSHWKYHDLLNPFEPGVPWKINPLWIEKKNRVKLTHKAISYFHQYPMSVCTLVTWNKIKDYELSCIRAAVERIRLNIEPSEAMKTVGIPQDGGANG